MYRFQVNAHTQPGEFIGIVGSTPELGEWDVSKCVRMNTNSDRYPLWWADVDIPVDTVATFSSQAIEYKYIRILPNGRIEWEAWGRNRWVPVEPDARSTTLVIEDGWIGYLPPCPQAYLEQPVVHKPLPKGIQGLKIVVIGSSVALGCNGWLLKGWTWYLEQDLHKKYGHQLVNVSEVGANVITTINRFQRVVAPEKPDIVIISLSLGNEGLAYCAPHERRAVQRRFESGLQLLVKMTQELGARPILGAVYPHGDYNSEHYWLLRETHERMLSWGVPVLNWLDALDDGQGRWKPGISTDPAHPNMLGHRLMYEAIDIRIFQISHEELAKEKQLAQQKDGILVFRDNEGFQIFSRIDEKILRVINKSPYDYTIAPYWQELQTAIQSKARLMPGIYIAKNAPIDALSFFSVRSDGTIETTLNVPPGTDLEYSAAFNFFSPKVSQILFYDGHLGILKESENFIRVINETAHEYNIHPMWKEVRSALKEMPPGVYEDMRHPDTPFRTMFIGKQGLESRVKVPPKSSVLFEYKCQLSEVKRVAIVPLGDRCALRMLLYKMEYDGPAFPFDLTRTSNLADVADIIANDFYDMWNPYFLQHYNPSEKRIYHSKWSGLSFAHEVEDTDNPIFNMHPVHERMRVRYSARAERFRYTLRNADKLLFIRTGGTTRGCVIDLMQKLESKCYGKPFKLLIFSLQDSQEFADIPNVLHYNLEFNPDRMYADLGHWLYCTEVLREILNSLGVSSKNLFWCPPNPPQD
ncbi:MAG: DUF1796 family putative cysteine peptidase [Oscillatoriaceae bacterium SKW80]|nr:DUF1796 family putative cysteine peptidase [Oscillatoriaceae bacterium SKYG93]MCX8121702.1 DUF1796 family putative cysteine peptidase [Oscillatoriaceae bacterium SKW80]MDW8453680.1 DUF1796 family putative cysteine peptidase [Oscillatoriaceae cyanobacterium SKYGB_i_bin93]HIK28746.1 lipase [Oscillatoriaceae cyanobacterium M7585_C2015_266]